ncbi:hypothetical protein L3i22_017860 [Actinoplanes sp. L3-i22]|nr:hypothetical protein L3i22_017860 [Actinoplanes sp. L3-i22]
MPTTVRRGYDKFRQRPPPAGDSRRPGRADGAHSAAPYAIVGSFARPYPGWVGRSRRSTRAVGTTHRSSRAASRSMRPGSGARTREGSRDTPTDRRERR